MTDLDRALRTLFPGARDRELDFLLWSCTAFPLCDPEETVHQLEEVREQCGSSRKRGWWRKVQRKYTTIMAEQEFLVEAREELAVMILKRAASLGQNEL